MYSQTRSASQRSTRMVVARVSAGLRIASSPATCPAGHGCTTTQSRRPAGAWVMRNSSATNVSCEWSTPFGSAVVPEV